MQFTALFLYIYTFRYIILTNFRVLYCMAISFLNGDVSDLCLGKPAIRWIPASAKVSDAVTALKRSGETHISVWTFDNITNESSECVGKICLTDVICFLCKEENLANPLKAVEAQISEILPKVPSIVRHLEPNSRSVLFFSFIIFALDLRLNLFITT